MRVTKITVRVETDTGDWVEFVENKPEPLGDNPAFMNRQVSDALSKLEERVQTWLGIFHKQYTPADERLDQVRSRHSG
jgi:hypothetical protein